MTGRNPWAVLGIAEDAPHQEILHAYRRRVKHTHPDSGGDAREFAAVVEAFEAIRRLRPTPLHHQGPRRPAPYGRWLQQGIVKGARADLGRPLHVAAAPPATPSIDFASMLAGEMTKAGAAAA
jgi:hypothetical protein